MNKYIVVNQPEKWNFSIENITVISSQEYLTNPKFSVLKNARIFNLCKDYSYQSKGYYVSLLAEARGHLAIPTVKNIVDLRALKLVRIVSDEFDDVIQLSLKNIKSQEFNLSIYFGQNVAQKYKELSSLFYRHFQVPFLRVKFSHSTKWNIQSIRAISESEIPNEHLDSVHEFANQYFSKKRYDTPKLTKSDFDLAILVNPNDPAPPSNPKALKKFIDIAEKMNIYAEIIEPKDLSRLSSFDALFIRQSTEVNNEAYAFARKAQQEGIAIIDYPDAILKCCNKVYMAEALNNANIDTPKTVIVHKDNRNDIIKEVGLPCVLKAPDSTFSFGVKKAKTKEEYDTLVTDMLKESDLIIAQEFCPSDYDWRIGIIDDKPFFACKYYMAKGHWQIYNWKANKKDEQDGDADSLPIEEVPKKVLKMALKSAKLMGKGLYGIDLKVVNKKPMVIEINDNPNIDFGVEDLHYGDLVYTKILSAFKKQTRLIMSKKYHLFEVYGIELEYMLVNNSNFKVIPIVDQLLTKKEGKLTADIDNGNIAWSNELVAHVIELKTNGPTTNLNSLSALFHENVIEINQLLESLNAQLLPTACHPLMNPITDTQLWKHSYSEVYELYNRIFNCKGHGWSNVQSTHINLPFFDDKEFEKLHAAIRVILPLIPGLCASSPILDGKKTGFKDTRLEYYKTNQKEIPEMTGLVIPERVFSKVDYYTTIFEPINKAIKPHDTKNILDHHFLNSRGAIARFDRNAIEIRLVDIQESPKADIAICVLIIEVLKLLVNKKLGSLKLQKKWFKEELFAILNPIIKDGETYIISNMEYLELFEINEVLTVQDIWKHLYALAKPNIHESHYEALDIILTNGTLATRILNAVGDNYSEQHISAVYTQLAQCLQENKLFVS